jgi:glutathione S-transferase
LAPGSRGTAVRNVCHYPDLGCHDGSVRIYHVATAADWAAAQASGSYTTSTYGVTLEQEGFLHASRADQWQAVRERYYADVTQPLVLLEIDTDLLDVPLVEEPPAPGVEETFPHIYGPLKPEAVVGVRPLD